MAGGKSRRFGRDKALLEISGETLLRRALRQLSALTAEQLVIGPPERREQAGSARVIQDEFPDVGPLGGIYTALHSATYESVLVVACDMPFLSAELLNYLIGLAPEADVVLPVIDGRGEQLHAVYRRTCLGAIREQLDKGDYKIDRFFDRMRLRTVTEDELRRFDPDLQSLWNVNTAQDWAEAQSRLSA
jgi:molybdenum cofactor guanylyltransferase